MSCSFTTSCRGFIHPFILVVRSTLYDGVCQPTLTKMRAKRFHLDYSRSFSASSLLAKKKKDNIISPMPMVTPSPPPKSPILSAAPSKMPAAATRPPSPASPVSYAEQLAQRMNGTVIYEGGPQRVFLFSSYTAAVFCFGAAGLNAYFNVFTLPSGLPTFVPWAFGIACLALTGFGTRFALMPANIVRSVRVLPVSKSARKPSPLSSGNSDDKVRLEVLIRRMTPIPGLSLKRLEILPSDFVMKTRIYKPRPNELERLAMRKAEKARRAAEHKYHMNHLMTTPFRDGAKVLKLLFSGLRRGLTGEGFMPVKITGNKYKLDVARGFALDKGTALDRIVKVESTTR